jgi:hypothetical protein
VYDLDAEGTTRCCIRLVRYPFAGEWSHGPWGTQRQLENCGGRGDFVR